MAPFTEDDRRRGTDPQQGALFRSLSPAERVPQDHPLRAIRLMVDAVLRELSPPLDTWYSQTGRPSIAPETLLRALLVQVLYTVRSERSLMEQLDDNLLFRWFVGLNMGDPMGEPTGFRKNRERWLAGDGAPAFFDHVLTQARAQGLLPEEHFPGDGTRIAAGAGQQSCQPKEPTSPQEPSGEPGTPSLDCRGERRAKAAHASTPDPGARVYKKAEGQEAQLCSLGPVLVENRHGLVIATRVTQAPGSAERDAALAMAEAVPGRHRITLGADQQYDTRDFVRELLDSVEV